MPRIPRFHHIQSIPRALPLPGLRVTFLMALAALVALAALSVLPVGPALAETTATGGDKMVEQADENIVEEVIVTESRYDENEALNLSNITGEELDLRQPDLPIPMLLQDLPGVFSYSDAGSNLGYTLWWVDMPDLAGSVQDIQVQRGVTNGMGGLTAMGGTINIMTEPLGAEEGGRASLSTGSYGFGRQMLKYQTGDLKGGFRSGLRISRQDCDGYRDRTGVDQWGVFWTGERMTAPTTPKPTLTPWTTSRSPTTNCTTRPTSTTG
ncbi:hypothetical protein CSA17_07600 [bacterium DOLJORAL78_65_58]|nr:MAG: hypothetical protein CSA17_07600 [bacterium DOLJORAL78_65_58]